MEGVWGRGYQDGNHGDVRDVLGLAWGLDNL